jgi:hypothetical protein
VKRRLAVILAALVAVGGGSAAFAVADSGNGPPGGVPAGAAVSGMDLTCKLPPSHQAASNMTLAEVNALCAHYGTKP